MTKFLFRFGYCTPAQWRANAKHGWDDECSGAFFVYAPTQDSALSFGREVAEQCVAGLFRDAGWSSVPSWSASDFASWVERTPGPEWPAEALDALPEVTVGGSKDITGW